MINKIKQLTKHPHTNEISLAEWVYNYKDDEHYIIFPKPPTIRISRFCWNFKVLNDGILAIPTVDRKKQYLYPKKSK